jgi:peptidoglycan/LPS O-acetylase OafA/YrhL
VAAGFSLAEVYQDSPAWFYPPWWRRFFLTLGGLLLLGAMAIYNAYGQGNLDNWTAQDAALTVLMLTLLGLNFAMTSILLDRHRPEFINVLFWGLLVCLFLAIYTPLSNFQSPPLPHLVASTVSTTNQLPAEL